MERPSCASLRAKIRVHTDDIAGDCDLNMRGTAKLKRHVPSVVVLRPIDQDDIAFRNAIASAHRYPTGLTASYRTLIDAGRVVPKNGDSLRSSRRSYRN